MLSRRAFLHATATTASLSSLAGRGFSAEAPARVAIGEPKSGEDLFAWIRRTRGEFDRSLYAQALGAANEFKEGDEIIGVAAIDEDSRRYARTLLSHTQIAKLDSHPLIEDQLSSYNATSIDAGERARSAEWTLGNLKSFLLKSTEAEIKAVARGLS
ncbi:MAG: ethanolamine ammonia-lyase subunit EutB, partial [Planctomycetes bacterium]|nr:ethanolamine ammonia-lyase subunit EutB [Planctomycetota bacterium]